jgi:hypothetical protein
VATVKTHSHSLILDGLSRVVGYLLKSRKVTLGEL